MVSANALRTRKADFHPRNWMLDSGAFSEIANHGRFRSSVEEYADQVNRWHRCGNLLAAVSQDYMCEPFMLAKTGLTTADHQRLTIERYDALRRYTAPYLLPVLQGFWPEEYVSHVRQYGNRLTEGLWVGVGSVCKRNANLAEIEQVLMAVKAERPDLRLHGFGIKTTALASSIVRDCLYSADSMAWSFAARREGRDGNSPQEAAAFVERIETQLVYQRAFSRRMF
jgi:hypothetical protein